MIPISTPTGEHNNSPRTGDYKSKPSKSDKRKFVQTESRASSIDYAEVKPNFKTTKLD